MRTLLIRVCVMTFVAATGLVGSVSTAQAAPLLLGQTVEYQYLFNTINTNYGNAANGNYVVGAGVEVNNIADGRGTLDISDTNLFVDYANASSWNGAAFNGFRITDINGTIPGFTGVTINAATNLVGFDASRISFDADHIWVNWQGLAFNANTVVSLDLQGAAAVPEPTSMLLLGSGLAFVARRRRQRRA